MVGDDISQLIFPNETVENNTLTIVKMKNKYYYAHMTNPEKSYGTHE